MNITGNASLVHFTESSFSVIDYIVFSLFLCISGAVGIFFYCRGQKTTGEYFLGNRQMKPIPVGISAGVSFMSSGVLVGIPAELYVNGYHYMFGLFFSVLAFFVGNVLVTYIVHPLKMTNLNQYFLKRFKSKILMYIVNCVVLGCIFHYMGFCMLGSVIAFHSITAGQVSIVVGLVIGGVVGVFYTSIGGLKAVVWTDVLQSVIMFLGTFIVVVKSVVDTPGGFGAIIEANKRYGRFHQVEWSPDPTIRHTMWGMIIGCFCNWLVWSSQPACVQRICSTPTRWDGLIVCGVTAVVFAVFTVLPILAGINIYGYYATRGCDIYAANWIDQNEIILYFIRERLNFGGFQGLFIAALYSGSLSSLSSGLNAASNIVWNDLTKPMLQIEVSEKKATLICKMIVVVFGILSMLWCYTLYRFGGLILQVCASIDASVYGAYFGLFLLAVFIRKANSKGAMVAIVFSFIITLWLGLGSLLYGKSKKPKLETPLEHCANHTVVAPYSGNMTATSVVEYSFLETIYSISYIWLSPICLTTLMFVGILVSLCTSRCDRKEAVDPKLLFPLCRPHKRNRRQESFSCCGGEEESVELAEVSNLKEDY